MMVQLVVPLLYNDAIICWGVVVNPDIVKLYSVVVFDPTDDVTEYNFCLTIDVPFVPIIRPPFALVKPVIVAVPDAVKDANCVNPDTINFPIVVWVNISAPIFITDANDDNVFMDNSPSVLVAIW